jgi:hypothetical protein
MRLHPLARLSACVSVVAGLVVTAGGPATAVPRAPMQSAPAATPVALGPGDAFAPLPLATGSNGVLRRLLFLNGDRSIAVFKDGLFVRAAAMPDGPTWDLSPIDITYDADNFVRLSPDGRSVLIPRRNPDRLVSVPLAGGAPVDVTGDLGINGLLSVDVTTIPGSNDMVFRKGQTLYRNSYAGGTPVPLTPPLGAGRSLLSGIYPSPDATWILYLTTGPMDQFRTLEAVELSTATPRTLLGTADLGQTGFVAYVVFPAGNQTVSYAADLAGGKRRVYRQNLSSGPAMEADDLVPTDGPVTDLAITPARDRLVFSFIADNLAQASEIRSIAATGYIAGTTVSVSGTVEKGQIFFTLVGDHAVFNTEIVGPSSTYLLRSGTIDHTEVRTLTPGLPTGAFASMALATPDGSTLLVQANMDNPNVSELFRVPVDASAPPLKLNAPVSVPAGQFAEVFPYEIDDAGQYVAYVVSRGSTDKRAEAFAAAMDGTGAAPIADGPPGSSVTDLRWLPSSTPGPQSLLYTYSLSDDTSEVLRAFRSPAGSSRFVPLPPARILDTRPGAGPTGYTGGEPGPGTTLVVPVAGRGGVPNAGAAAVVVNVTGTEAMAPGFVTVWPGGAGRPTASNLNLEGAGQTRPNLVTVPVGPDGTIQIFTQSGTHLIADVLGYYEPAATATAGRFEPLPPARLLDTRPGAGQTGYAGDKPGPGTILDLAVAGRGGVPPTGAAAVVLNVTATEATAPGFVTVWPDGVVPTASNVNLDQVDQTIANQVIVPLGPDGHVRLYTQSGTHLIADVAGWFTDDSARLAFDGIFVPVLPARILETRAAAQTGYTGPKPGPGATVDLTVAGHGGVPSANAVGVVANVTATEATAAGFVTVWPDGPRPTASNLNLERADETIANHVTSPLGPSGGMRLFTQSGTHLVTDITGWYLGA